MRRQDDHCMYWSKRVNLGSVFEPAFLMCNIEEPAFILLDVQQYALSKVTLPAIHHLLFVFVICEAMFCTTLKISLLLFHDIHFRIPVGLRYTEVLNRVS